jgi:hypothetical protein
MFRSGYGTTAVARDHDHEKGTPRGLLCSSCNLVLGHYERILRGRLILHIFEEYLTVHEKRLDPLLVLTQGTSI